MIPSPVYKKVKNQANKFNFRSSRLRDLIKHQILTSKGQMACLNTVRHYVNAKGVSPYDELWLEIKPYVQSYADRHALKSPKKAKEAKVMMRKAHESYQNMINKKIYTYTIQMMYKELNK